MGGGGRRGSLNEWFTGVFSATPLNVWSNPFVVFIIWLPFQQQQRLEGEFSGNKWWDVTPSPVMLCLWGSRVAGYAILGLEITFISLQFFISTQTLGLLESRPSSPVKISRTDWSYRCSWSPSDHRWVGLSPESQSDLLICFCPGDLTARCVYSHCQPSTRCSVELDRCSLSEESLTLISGLSTQIISAGRNSFVGRERSLWKGMCPFFFIKSMVKWNSDECFRQLKTQQSVEWTGELHKCVCLCLEYSSHL